MGHVQRDCRSGGPASNGFFNGSMEMNAKLDAIGQKLGLWQNQQPTQTLYAALDGGNTSFYAPSLQSNPPALSFPTIPPNVMDTDQQRPKRQRVEDNATFEDALKAALIPLQQEVGNVGKAVSQVSVHGSGGIFTTASSRSFPETMTPRSSSPSHLFHQ